MNDFKIIEALSNCSDSHTPSRTGDAAEIRVLLFVQEGSAKQKYLDALSQCGAQVFVTSSFFDLSAEICSRTYHGLFLDLPTKLKAIKENKAFVYRLVERFPVSHLQMDGVSGEVRCYHLNRQYGSTLIDFINNQCRIFTPQKIRPGARTEINLPVLIYKHQADKRPERSITNNLSAGGCFIFSCRRWKEGNDIWIRFKDCTDPQPICARIKMVVKWGNPRQIPGIGVQFKELSPLQLTELAQFYRLDDRR